MKTVVPSREVAHLWIHESQPEARNSGKTFYFEGPTIYSYGCHFPIARIYKKGKRRLVLFTSKSYSVTTSKHMSWTRQAIPSDIFTVYVEDVGPFAGQPIHDDNWKNLTRQAENARLSAARARKNAEWNLSILNSIRKHMLAYRSWFALPAAKFPIPAPFDKAKANILLAKQKEAARLTREKQERELAAQREKTLAALPYWRAHKTGEDVPEELRSGTNIRSLGFDALRLSEDKSTVETTRGATFPAEHAVKFWPFLKKIRAGGVEWLPNGHSVHLGNYTVDKIRANGDIEAGCHFVPFTECAILAAELGLPS